MSGENDPRTEGLGLALRPTVRSASVPPPPRKPAPAPSRNDPDDAEQPPAAEEPPEVAAADPDDAEQPPAAEKPPEVAAEVAADPDAPPPRVGSRRGGSVQVATSVPYDIADALADRAESEDITIGSVVIEAVRSEAPGIVAKVPPRPRRAGKTTVRQFLISPAEAEQLARHLDQVPATERLTVSLLLRHCLSRHLTGR